MNELELLEDADTRARNYVAGIADRRVFPDTEALNNLAGFDEELPTQGAAVGETLALLDRLGSPATVGSNGPNYYGFVLGATLPEAAAAERMALAWDQCASSADSAPGIAKIEAVAGKWVLDILDLPKGSAVAFGTSATACGLSALAAARGALLARHGWDFERDGLVGAPEIRVVVSDLAHITVIKALRILGFGLRHILRAPTDGQGRVDPAQLPRLDDRTILCLQAGEVNTGNFDDFATLIPHAHAAGAWVHVDGAFGLWARASAQKRHLATGVELADSWTTDGHKWLNTPYDGAMCIMRNPADLARAMNADAAYSASAADAQKNLTLEFSRRARGVPIWAALRSLGRDGVAHMVDRHCAQAQKIGAALAEAGYEVLNDVALNQVLVRAPDDHQTHSIMKQAQASGELWFGPTVWQGRPAFRISLSSWRTRDVHVDRLIAFLSAQI